MLNFDVIGEGRTTKVYRDGNRAVKLYENAPPEWVHREARHQEFALDAGLPVPRVYGVSALKAGIALEMEYIPGRALMSAEMGESERAAALNALVKLQCGVHQVVARSLPKQVDMIAYKIENAPCLGKPAKHMLLSALKSLDRSKTNLCHGDFHPLNILRTDEGKLWIIDWVDATAGDPFADACRSYLIFAQFVPGMADAYLRLFCEETNARREDVLAWLPIVAAARLTENLDEIERASLVDVVSRYASPRGAKQ